MPRRFRHGPGESLTLSITTAQAASTLENVLFESPALAAANAKTANLSTYASADAYAQALASSAEFGITAQVIRYYTDALGRIPAGSEIAYYVNLVENGSTAAGIAPMTAAQIAGGTVPQASWNTIATYFAASPEFQKDFGLAAANSVSVSGQAAMIDLLYANILGRTASAAEVAYYENALDSGFKPSDLVQFFSNSPEFLSDASAKIQADVVAYANAIATGTTTNTTAISNEPLVTPAAVYSISHDGQASITEGGSETFTISATNVAAGTTLYYSLSGVTAAEVAGGDLTGTITLGTYGIATLTVALTNPYGQGLSGNLTASISSSATGSALASSSVLLSETGVSGIVVLGNLGGGNSGTVSTDFTDSGLIVGFSGIGGSGTSMFRSGNNGADHAFIWQDGVITDLGTLPGYSYQSEAWAVNGAGEVVGWSVSGGTTGTTDGHAFLWLGGTMTDLGTLPGAKISQAHGINDYGQVVGQSGNDAFLWQPTAQYKTTGTMIDLGSLPGYQYAMGMAIDNYGVVTGYATNNGSDMVAFLWIPTARNSTTGAMVNLGSLNGDNSVQPWAINSGGEVVGTSISGSTALNDAWVWTPSTANTATGTMMQLAALGGAGCGAIAYSVNDSDFVAGMSQTTASGIYHATVWEGDTPVDLNSLLPVGSGWVLTEADSINNDGYVTGQGLYNGTYASFEIRLPGPAIVESVGPNGTVTLPPGNNAANHITLTQTNGSQGSTPQIVTLGLHDGGSTIDVSAVTIAMDGNPTTEVGPRIPEIANAVDGLTKLQMFSASGTSADLITSAQAFSVPAGATFDQAIGLAVSAANSQAVANPNGLESGGSHTYDWFTFGSNVVVVGHNGTPSAGVHATDVIVVLTGLTSLQHFSVTGTGEILI